MTDWNWFFSSVAQSIAALDGTLVAFVVAKLVNSQAEFVRQQSQASELIARAQRLRDAASIRFFEWYNERQVSHLYSELERLESRSAGRLSAEKYLDIVALPEFLSRQRSREVISEWLRNREKEEEEEQERRASERRARSNATSVFGGVAVPDLMPIPNLANAALERAAAQEEFDREREAIRQLRVEVYDCIRAARLLYLTLSDAPPFSALVKWTLIAALGLFVSGVIYPLSFLPVALPWEGRLSIASFFDILFSLRGLVLAIPVMVFGGLIVALLFLNRSLRHPSARLEQLALWTHDGQYSPHFAVWRENREQSAPPKATQ